MVTGSNGTPMEVTPDKRGTVQALSELDNALRKASCQVAAIYAPVTNVADTADNEHLVIKNTDTMKQLVVDQIIINTTLAGQFFVKKGQLYASGGTAAIVNSLNLGQSATPFIEAYYDDNLTMSGTAVTMFAKYAAAASTITFDIPIMIPPGMALLITCVGAAGSEVIKYTVVTHTEQM
jgi:hypothetical protein